MYYRRGEYKRPHLEAWHAQTQLLWYWWTPHAMQICFMWGKSKSPTRLCLPNLGLHPKKFSLWMTLPRTSSLSGAVFPAMFDSSPKQWTEGVRPPYEVNDEHLRSFAKCFDCSNLFSNSSTVVFRKKKMGRLREKQRSLEFTRSVDFFLQASGYMCSTSARWAFGRSVEPCLRHVQRSSERYQLRSTFPNLPRKVVGCRLSEKSGLTKTAVFSHFSNLFQSACGWTKTHRWRILYLCKIQNPTKLYWIFHFRTLHCPSERQKSPQG